MFRRELKLPRGLAQAASRESLISWEGKKLLAGVQVVNFFHYVEWDRKRVRETIERELGWKNGEDRLSSWRFDCKITELVNYLWTKYYGIPKDAVGCASMIRSGHMTREEALHQLGHSRFGEFRPGFCDLLMNEMGLSKKRDWNSPQLVRSCLDSLRNQLVMK